MSLVKYEPNTLLPSPADKEILALREEVKRLKKYIKELESQLQATAFL